MLAGPTAHHRDVARRPTGRSGSWSWCWFIAVSVSFPVTNEEPPPQRAGPGVVFLGYQAGRSNDRRRQLDVRLRAFLRINVG